jgi:hypothetical protein
MTVVLRPVHKFILVLLLRRVDRHTQIINTTPTESFKRLPHSFKKASVMVGIDYEVIHLLQHDNEPNLLANKQ